MTTETRLYECECGVIVEWTGPLNQYPPQHRCSTHGHWARVRPDKDTPKGRPYWEAKTIAVALKPEDTVPDEPPSPSPVEPGMNVWAVFRDDDDANRWILAHLSSTEELARSWVEKTINTVKWARREDFEVRPVTVDGDLQ